MSKQEEIKEFLEYTLCIKGVDDFRKCEDCVYFVDGRGCDRVYATQKFLESRGVVIKVDRELPEPDIENSNLSRFGKNWYSTGYMECRGEMVRNKYVAVEPLVGEEK